MTMSSRHLLVAILVVALLVMAVRPTPAEADVLTALAIAGAVAAIIVLVVFLVVANMEERRRAEAPTDAPELVLVYVATPQPDAP